MLYFDLKFVYGKVILFYVLEVHLKLEIFSRNVSPALACRFFTTEPPGKPLGICVAYHLIEEEFYLESDSSFCHAIVPQTPLNILVRK